MWGVFETIAANAGSSFEWIIVIIYTLGSILIAAKDVRIAIIVNMVISGGVFMWFYTEGLNYRPTLITFFMSLILLAFTLYVTGKESAARGIT